ncbi:MAG TPA: 4-hydroxy-tetrahydrodipicolinate reductase [Rubrivivax sp.]|nr:4-hydroxy-tetrahydrodipicolinate reductase [Rubrivivax sp.]
MLKIAVAGCSGRMGRMLVQAVLDSADCQLSGALAQPSNPAVGQDAGSFAGRETGVAITSDIRSGLAGADVLIDFTQPAGTLAHLAVCGELGVRAVVGTTGFTVAEKLLLAGHAQQVGVVLGANMSVGVNVMLRLLAQAAAALDASYDIEVVEAHHKHKVDAPSGTALAIGEVLARARGIDLAGHGVFERHGHTGPRAPGSIGFATVRGGDIVGEHTVLFAGTGERIEIAHKSSSRANYAQGSLRAARFLADRGPGLYGMSDVLGLA